MTRLQLSGYSTRMHNSLNPRLEGCHLDHHTGLLAQDTLIGLY